MFYVIEIQKNAQGQYAHLVTTDETQSGAESKYYTVLAAAAISNLPLHTAALLRDDGIALMSKSYRREANET